ncbi:MAG: Dabb family protein [Sphingobacteriales bacterium]|nr:MAG: Dabb family protein [Sphingobacteriales bacterium]
MSNNRRKFITSTAALAVGTIVSAKALPAAKAEYPVSHHVFFWLKNPGSVEDRDKLIAGVKALAKIETVRELHVSVVASTEKRDVVDNSWGVSELMFFSDLTGQATYQDHPIHQQFIKECSHLWDKVIVYDAIEV